MKLFSYPHGVWFVKSNESLSNAIVFLMTIRTVLIIRFWTVVYCVFNLTEKNFRQENHELPHNRYLSRIYTGRKTSTLFAIYNNIAPFCYWHKNRENVAPTGKHSSKKKKNPSKSLRAYGTHKVYACSRGEGRPHTPRFTGEDWSARRTRRNGKRSENK